MSNKDKEVSAIRRQLKIKSGVVRRCVVLLLYFLLSSDFPFLDWRKNLVPIERRPKLSSES